jgi:hypothetical protein
MEALANWIWQGSVVALVATAALRAPQVLGATARYRLWWLAVAIVLALPIAPTVASALKPAVDPAFVAPVSGALQRASTGPWLLTIPALPRWTTVLIASMWIAWMVVFGARIAAALVALRRARRDARPFPPDREGRLENWMALRT